jgi:hypothetical protein
MYIYLLEGVNFAKDYQKDSYNKRSFNEKKKMITTYEPHSETLIIFKLWNSRTLKIQRMIQNCFKLLEF